MIVYKSTGFYCDKCDKHRVTIKTEVRYRCVECDEDYCLKCVKIGNRIISRVIVRAILHFMHL